MDDSLVLMRLCVLRLCFQAGRHVLALMLVQCWLGMDESYPPGTTAHLLAYLTASMNLTSPALSQNMLNGMQSTLQHVMAYQQKGQFS